MKRKIFQFLFKKEIAGLIKKECDVKETFALKEMQHRKYGNPMRLYNAFVNGSAKCGMVMFMTEGTLSEKIKMLEDRAMDLMSPETLSRNDLLSLQTTYYNEIELLLIRIIVRYAKKYGSFPERNQYILEKYEDLAKDRIGILHRFKENVMDKLLP